MSALAPPKHALTAELLEIKVSLSFTECCKEAQTRQHSTETPTLQSTSDLWTVMKREPVDELETLDCGDMAAIEAFLFSSGWHNDGRILSGSRHDPLSKASSQEMLTSESFVQSMKQALDVLLHGNNKRHYGVKWLAGRAWPGLVHLAPAVFHMPYLEVSEGEMHHCG